MLGEEQYIPQSILKPVLLDALVSRFPRMRYFAVKALWQARVRESVPQLKSQLAKESSTDVRAVLHRALAVLG